MKTPAEKKLRSDAWEAPLSAELREKFYFAIEPLDFPEGSALAAKEPYSLRPTSMQAYYRCQARARAAIEKAKTRANALAKLETAQAVAPLVRSAAVNAVGDSLMADTLASLAATAVMQGATSSSSSPARSSRPPRGGWSAWRSSQTPRAAARWTPRRWPTRSTASSEGRSKT